MKNQYKNKKEELRVYYYKILLICYLKINCYQLNMHIVNHFKKATTLKKGDSGRKMQ